jgi:D-alanyl-D-alanine carboxypeptidase (penicillin-binding protein 5/6)
MGSTFRRPAGGRPRTSRAAAAAAIAVGLAATPLAVTPLLAPGVALAKVVAPDPLVGPNPVSSGVLTTDDVVGGGELGEPEVVVDSASGAPALPAITATSFVIADADTGAVLAAHNAHQKLAPASTLKTLTAVTLLPRLKPDFPTMAQPDAPRTDGTKAGIVAGTVYKVNDLFTAMLMMSANDAAVALADANGGLAPTLAEMNAEAAELHAGDTVAKTPNGLDAAGQSSSAYDLALIFRAGLAMPQFRHYLSLPRAAFPAPNGQSFQIQTHDHLLTDYSGMVGGKNGYTVAAQASYVGAATRGGHTIIVAVMRDQPNFWNEVKTLLDWGFAADGTVQPVGELVKPGEDTPAPTAKATVAAKAGAAAAPGAAPTAKADAPTAKAAVPVAKPARTTTGGVAVNAILMWVAVAIGGGIFLLAVIRFIGHRRHRNYRDERYLAGLSRLSALERVSERP